jgi:uncharacterized protein YutE (UPF0331/DUF86 family)/predicted nucleotidyltransferase
LRTVLAGRGNVVAAYLFGSVARDTATPTSDVDVAVLFVADPPSTIDGLHLRLEGELERVLGVPAQLVVLNRAPCDLIHRVLRDGVLLVDRDPRARIRFEVDARNRYFDLQPFLRRYRRFPVDAATLTDSDLIAKRLAFTETRTRELTTMARLDRVHEDLKEERFVEHTLQLAIQAALDVASHIASDERLGEPATNRELFDRLAAGGWISKEHAAKLGDMAGFRNVLVHGYQDVDLDIVVDAARNRLEDLTVFVAAVRKRLAS